MTAWQYFAGAGLVAALCPLQGHVAVAGDGHGRGARVDLCVPAGQPRPPEVRPPAGAAVPGADRPTVHHPGQGPEPAPAAPEPLRLPDAPVPVAKALPGDPKPPAPAPGPAPEAGTAPAEAPAPPRAEAAVASARAFHVRPYRAVALERRNPGGMSTVMLMVVVTTPAVLAAAALRPRSKSRG